ncbi:MULTISPECIES: hypothetical protein [unclassified Neisseria]|uniref:hypothetical protein n=1 Tax=unclassified Neisseria TaxID=2623750 RepID=UPI0026654CBD|nr:MULTISPECIES: hypothetical protein [unclassified Neisseria]MDO1510036.1 hypothetical protein [Neisseria sp. MVDL19-042950]MDO1516934.1 hypothetical protein [Neisseria sp. MVDL18-041461]MDO1564219.1 hypothetical protein [Neisseria sp. MVDL20-010259]
MFCIVNEYVLSQLDNLSRDYTWDKFRLDSLPEGVHINIDQNWDLAKKNLQLRQQLHEHWKVSSLEKREKLAKWYVKNWGGIRTNDKNTISGYAELEPQDLIKRKGITGISSWSKVLSIVEPRTYAIFDSRVAFSLNALLLQGKYKSKFFPVLSSRNTKIAEASDKFKLMKKNNRKQYQSMPSKDVYYNYLKLLKEVAIACDTSIQEVEMLLFAHTEVLADVVLDI